ncbi:hypothetical protein ACFYQ5_17375 [Streptomyces sp. NPDC005794]|uniref:hypothetical protein n=1 Tax=Streptomyces sp. NPDC005794 TaxID=3364733 RepID=UPI00369A06DA
MWTPPPSEAPALVTAGALLPASLTAVLQAFDPPLNPLGTIALLCMAAGLGTASGVYAYGRTRTVRRDG